MVKTFIMNRHQSVILYGSLIIATGAFMMAMQSQPINVIRFGVAACLAVCAVVGFITAMKSDDKQVRFSYHNLHAGAILAYAGALFIAGISMDRFMLFSAVYFIFYSFSEIIFCFWLFNLEQQVGFRVLIQRLLIGFSAGIGAIVILSFTGPNFGMELMGFGILLMLTGVNVVFYKPVIKAAEIPVSAT
jgi:hypothetical protein